MTEQELLDKLAEAELDWLDAKRRLTAAKKLWTDAETKCIDTKLHKERLEESLRVLRAKKVIPGEDYSLFDEDDGNQ
jgi:hypothetical protein